MANLLVGGRGFAQRQGLVVFLEDLEHEEYQVLFTELLAGEVVPSERLGQFRQLVKERYGSSFDAGRFGFRKTQRPNDSAQTLGFATATDNPRGRCPVVW